MRVSEIFHSISGEGVHAGVPTIFIRLTGCNLSCSFCDTKYAQNLSDGKEMTALRIADIVRGFSRQCERVLVTGGEPLLQQNLVHTLVSVLKSSHYLIEIETNGSINPPTWFKFVDCWSVDVKCPSSGPSYGSFRPVWLKRLRKRDQLKFVVGTEKDLNFVRDFLIGTKVEAVVLVSPVIVLRKRFPDSEVEWGRPWLQKVAEFCKEQNVRMSLQLHKIIWGNKIGV